MSKRRSAKSSFPPRRVCFVSGTRADFGLMERILRAVREHSALQLHVAVTGMHLDRGRGFTLKDIEERWHIDARVRWRAPGNADAAQTAKATALATADLVDLLDRLNTDIVLVLGDRVEAFAAATAGHISGRVVAHVHGGDRAQGLVDDALRHAITKLAHLHFPATADAARRLKRLGEDDWRVHLAGTPGIEGIAEDALPLGDVNEQIGSNLADARFALLVLHPAGIDEQAEHRRARTVLQALKSARIPRLVVIDPNNDPGSGGIVHAWDEHLPDHAIRLANVTRPAYLGLMRHAAMLVGNSSSGIIEAASFGLPVIDVGPRQSGRLRSNNTMHCEYDSTELLRLIRHIWRDGSPRRSRSRNIYAGDKPSTTVAKTLAKIELSEQLRRKLIAY